MGVRRWMSRGFDGVGVNVKVLGMDGGDEAAGLLTSGGTVAEEVEAQRMHWFSSFSTAAVVPLLYGMEVGATSNILRLFGELRDAENDMWMSKLGSIETGIIASTALLGAVFGGVLAYRLADRLGRRKEFIAAGSLFFAGSLVTSLSTSLPTFVLGRLLYGVGEGIGMHAALLYTGEIVPAHWRGVCGGSIEILWVFGLFTSMMIGLFVGSWREANLPLVAVSFPFLLACTLLPESPRWIVLDRRSEGLDDAVEAFKQLGRDHVESVDLSNDILAHIEEIENKEDGSSGADEEIHRAQALTIGLFLVLMQQLTGQPSILYHLGDTFERVGVGRGGAVLVSLVKTVVTAIEKLGRRILLLTGISTMLVSLAALALVFATEPPYFPVLVVCLFITYIIGYQIGFGPVTWLLLSEIFPLRHKAMSTTLCTITNFLANWFVLILFDVERTTIGVPAQFMQYAVLSSLAIVFVYYRIPETKGLSLEEISKKIVVDAKQRTGVLRRM